jgi:hypothetical protein
MLRSLRSFRGSGRLGRCVPAPPFTHIFAVAGTLRVPLSQPPKRRKQPERYATLNPKILKKNDSTALHGGTKSLTICKF